MKKFINALPGSKGISKGKTVNAIILKRDGQSILLRLQNGTLATIDLDNLFLRDLTDVWFRIIAGKRIGDRMRVKITNIYSDGSKARVIPVGQFQNYAPIARDLSEAIRYFEELKESISKSYKSLTKQEEFIGKMKREEQMLNYSIEIEKDKKNLAVLKERLSKVREDLIETEERAEGKNLFIRSATLAIVEAKETLSGFDLLQMAN